MSAADLLAALEMDDSTWEAAEQERERQQMETTFVAKWLPVWRQWGHAMPGYERTLAESGLTP